MQTLLIYAKVLIARIRSELSNPSVSSLYRQATIGEVARQRNNEPFINASYKVFSQSDEDGLLQRCIELCGEPSSRTFIEIGVGNGTENNTLLLLLQGWRGAWIGGEKIVLEPNPQVQIKLIRAWVDVENICDLVGRAMISTGLHDQRDLDVFSLDLDGNDYDLCERLLQSNFCPKVWIQEYNGSFGPNVEWRMKYDKSHRWNHDNYFGASYKSFCKLFGRYGYKPVVCSSNGANVFFVRKDSNFDFENTPEENDLWVKPNNLIVSNGHPVSKRILNGFVASYPNR